LRYLQRVFAQVIAACAVLSGTACLVLWSAPTSNGVGSVGNPGLGSNPSHATGLSRLQEETISPYTVEACGDIRGPQGESIHPAKLAALATAGFSRCTVALGAMVVATEAVNPNLVLFAANMLGELLDKNCDGHPDDQSVVEPFSAYNSLGYSAVLTMGGSFAEEQPAFNGWSLVAVPSGAYRLHDGLGWEGTKAVIAEQAFHLVHRHGWAIAFPSQFGFPSTWTTQAENSHACDCMKEAQCTWYQHASNRGCKSIRGEFCMNPTVPGDHTDSSVLPGTCQAAEGTCADPECDCLKFVHKVFVAYTGDIPAQGDLYANQLEPWMPFSDHDRVRKLSNGDGISSMKDNMMRSQACTLFLRDIENVSLPFPRRALVERARKRQCA